MSLGQISSASERRTLPVVLAGAAIVALSLMLLLIPGRTVLIMLGIPLLFTAMVRYPVIGLALICSLLTVEGISGEGITEIHLVGIASFAAWIIHLLLFGRALRLNRAFFPLMLLVIWAGISFLWAGDVIVAGPRYLTLLQLVILYVLAINVIETRRDLAFVLGVLILGAMATSWFSIRIFTENFMERARVFESQNANGYAAAVGLGIIGAVYFVKHGRFWWSRVLAFAAACSLAVPLLLAQSRSAWMGTIAALAVFLWHTRRRWRNMFLVAGTTLALLTGIYLSGLVSFSLVDRAVGLVQLQDRGSDRFDIWQVAIRMIRDNPVVGVGFFQFPREYNGYRARTPEIRQDQFSNRDAHNLYFAMTAELGLVGLVILFLFFWNLWRSDDLPPGSDPGLARSLLAYLMLFAMGGTIFLSKFTWVAVGLAARARVLAREDTQKGDSTG